MIITLTGFMGCGKSSVGRFLSELLCCPFMDLDAVIEDTQGRSIPDIFAAEGEAAFRQMEVEALSQIIEARQLRGQKPCYPSGRRDRERSAKAQWSFAASSHSAGVGGIVSDLSAAGPANYDKVVVALGGGAVMTPACAELVREKTHCIYLRASIDTLVSHLENEAEGRPMLQGSSLRARIQELMALRSATYEATAHDVIDTDGKTIADIATAIINRGA